MHERSRSEDETLSVQRIQLERGGKLGWLHWGVIALSTAFALFAWRYSITHVEDRARTQFERHGSVAVGLAQDRLDRYAVALNGAASFLTSSERVSLDEWHRYTDSLQLTDRFPALRSFGIAYDVPAAQRERFVSEQREYYPDFKVFPEHDGLMSLPVALIWPANYERTATGLDLAREPDRRAALRQALDTGATQLTGLVTLGVSGKQGLVMLDAFENAGVAGSATGRGHGVAMAVILASQLFDGLSAEQGSAVAIRLSDQDGVIYEDEAFPVATSDARMTQQQRVSVHGRDWVFELRSTPTFDQASMFWLPTAVLFGGLLINALVLTLFLGLSRSNRAALNYATLAGRALNHDREELAVLNRDLSRANSELEAFGHALSHDLRTPLNGIQVLVEFVSEDLAVSDLNRADRENIECHLGRVQRQVARGKDLITGMLDYAGMSASGQRSSDVDVSEMLDDIADGMRLGPDRFQRPEYMPVMHTSGTRLGQVFANLIGNAVKYHPSPDKALIQVEASERGDMVQFAVNDNGDGIEPQYRERAFELFGKAHSRSDIESSGVGLSIVKKSIEQAGGTVAIEDAASGGARIVFTWPKAMPEAA